MNVAPVTEKVQAPFGVFVNEEFSVLCEGRDANTQPQWQLARAIMEYNDGRVDTLEVTGDRQHATVEFRTSAIELVPFQSTCHFEDEGGLKSTPVTDQTDVGRPRYHITVDTIRMATPAGIADTVIEGCRFADTRGGWVPCRLAPNEHYLRSFDLRLFGGREYNHIIEKQGAVDSLSVLFSKDDKPLHVASANGNLDTFVLNEAQLAGAVLMASDSTAPEAGELYDDVQEAFKVYWKNPSADGLRTGWNKETVPTIYVGQHTFDSRTDSIGVAHAINNIQDAMSMNEVGPQTANVVWRMSEPSTEELNQ